jgi:hypothetical protein
MRRAQYGDEAALRKKWHLYRPKVVCYRGYLPRETAFAEVVHLEPSTQLDGAKLGLAWVKTLERLAPKELSLDFELMSSATKGRKRFKKVVSTMSTLSSALEFSLCFCAV